MKRRKPPKMRKRILAKYTICGLSPATKAEDVKALLARIVNR